MQTWTRAQRWAFAGIVVLAASLRFYTLAEQPFWSDEWFTLKMVQQPHWIQTVLMCLVTDFYPPLVYLLTRLSVAFGDGLIQLRFFSFLGGIAAVAMVFVLARRWAGTRAAVYAGLLAALSPMGVYYAQEFKLYSFFSAVCLWILYEALESLASEQPRWKRLSLATAVGMYTYYITPYVLLPLFIAGAVAWGKGRRPQAWNAAKGMSVGLLAALPLLPFFLKAVMMFEANFWDLGREALIWTTVQNFSTGFVAPERVAIIAGLLFLLAVAQNFRRRGLETWAVAIMLAFAIFPSSTQYLQALLTKPSYSDRALLGAAYGWCLAAGLGLAVLPKRGAAALLGLMLAINAYSLHLHYEPATRSRFDYKVSYEALKTVWQPGDAIIHMTQQSLFPYNYYARREGNGMLGYEKMEDPGFNFNATIGRARELWRRFHPWLKERGLGIDSGLDPYRAFGDRLRDVAVGDSKRLWYVVPRPEVLDRCFQPMLNLWRNGFHFYKPFDMGQEKWLGDMGFRLKESREISPGVDVYLFER